MKIWKKVFHASGNQKEAKVAVLIADKNRLQSKLLTGDKERPCVLKRGSIYHEGETVITCMDTESPTTAS